MITSHQVATSRMPSHGGPWLDWSQPKVAERMISHNGVSGESFTYIAPTPKYVEAYNAMTGPGWGGYVSYLNYNHGNQPYDHVDSGLNTAFRTPQLPNWYALSKVSPKTSAAGTQQAQLQLSRMLASRVAIGSLVGFP